MDGEYWVYHGTAPSARGTAVWGRLAPVGIDLRAKSVVHQTQTPWRAIFSAVGRRYGFARASAADSALLWLEEVDHHAARELS